MAATFFALHVEDRPGTLGQVAGILSEAGVNIEAFAADKSGVRVLTDDRDRAAQCLKEHGIGYDAVEVIEIELPNQPGQLARIGKALGDHGVNIVTSFGAAPSINGGRIYIRVDDVDAAWDALDGIH